MYSVDELKKTLDGIRSKKYVVDMPLIYHQFRHVADEVERLEKKLEVYDTVIQENVDCKIVERLDESFEFDRFVTDLKYIQTGVGEDEE